MTQIAYTRANTCLHKGEELPTQGQRLSVIISRTLKRTV